MFSSYYPQDLLVDPALILFPLVLLFGATCWICMNSVVNCRLPIMAKGPLGEEKKYFLADNVPVRANCLKERNFVSRGLL